MNLATVDADGRPAARMVLLNQCGPQGLTFYTNYQSRKAREMAQNPYVALVFYWEWLHRQVRVESGAQTGRHGLVRSPFAAHRKRPEPR